jgi:hypothetical protein
MGLSLEALKHDPQLWKRYSVRFNGQDAPIVPEIVPIAFEFLSSTNTVETVEKDNPSTNLMAGALNALGYHASASPGDAFFISRRVGAYFSSRNVNLAFTAIRCFEYQPFGQYAMFVSDQLVAVASCDTPTPSPIEMTIRGIAFLVLFQIDPGFKFWSCLRSARDECVHGLLTWGADRESYSALARMILQYT